MRTLFSLLMCFLTLHFFFLKMLNVILLFWGILGTCLGKRKKTVDGCVQFLSCFLTHFQMGFVVAISLTILFYLDQHTDFLFHL